MADPVVTLTNGVPTSGNGAITTLGQTLTDGANITHGAIADAAVTAGATGSISAKLRSISRDIGSLVTAIGSTAWDLGAGTAGTRTQRMIIDSSQLGSLGGASVANSAPTVNADQYSQYEIVGASATNQALGASGAAGDYLAGVLVFPGTAGCGTVTILDNAISLGVFAGGGTTPLPSLVPFIIPIGLFSVSGAWKITTTTNVTCVGIGKFT